LAVIDRQPERIDVATHEPARTIEIDAERANDDGPSLGHGKQPIEHGAEHGTREGRVEEEDRAVIEVRVTHVANAKAYVDPQACGTLPGLLNEGGLELDPSGRGARKQRSQ
jgi:hypothetical protein